MNDIYNGGSCSYCGQSLSEIRKQAKIHRALQEQTISRKVNQFRDMGKKGKFNRYR